ncbi:dienelactone hydrolase family protein [Candidatus Woesearchaeota archaeon]|nr:dienelactone hydrolase family protein [Candidatus Woesearchaeota archaeon]
MASKNNPSLSVFLILILAVILTACAAQPATTENAKESAAGANQVADAAEPGQSTNADLTRSEDSAGMEIMAGETAYYLTTDGYLARPAAEGKYPAVIMIHEWWGLNDNIRDMARQLAAEGYVVLAVDLYNGQVAQNSSIAGQLAGAVRQDTEPALENMKAAVNFLKARDDVIPDKIASMGWCFGGGMSLQLALTGTPLAATIIYYGSLETDPEKLAAIKQPVLGIFGDQDTGIPVATVLEFNSTLGSIGVPRDIYIYPGVGHAFANPSGANYAPEETMDAWQKTLDFLARNLKQ